MKLTKSTLKQMIQEEMDNIQTEGLFGDMFGSSKTKDDADAYDRKTKLDLLQQWKELVAKVKSADRQEPMTGDLASYFAAKVQERGDNDWTMVGIDDIKNNRLLWDEIELLTALMHEWKPRAWWDKHLREGSIKMKLTKSQLKQIIQEEIENMQNEGVGDFFGKLGRKMKKTAQKAVGMDPLSIAKRKEAEAKKAADREAFKSASDKAWDDAGKWGDEKTPAVRASEQVGNAYAQIAAGGDPRFIKMLDDKIGARKSPIWQATAHEIDKMNHTGQTSWRPSAPEAYRIAKIIEDVFNGEAGQWTIPDHLGGRAGYTKFQQAVVDVANQFRQTHRK